MLDAEEALRRGYISRPEQLIRCEEYTRLQGDGRTLCFERLALPCGLEAIVSWDRCMDIPELRYRGMPVNYCGKNEEREDLAVDFSRRFSGGMLYTCGLLRVGDGDGRQPTHGRIHMQPSSLRSVTRTRDAVVLVGEMREAALFGENLLLRRRMTFDLHAAQICIEDTIENQTPQAQPVMLLYHINLGYPFLNERTRLLLPDGTRSVPVGEEARRDFDRLAVFDPPTPNRGEQDFHHELPHPDGMCRLSAVSDGLRFSLSYRADTLPYLVEWRCLRAGDYVLGLEPSNNHVDGQPLAQIEPFGEMRTRVLLRFDEEDIQ